MLSDSHATAAGTTASCSDARTNYVPFVDDDDDEIDEGAVGGRDPASAKERSASTSKSPKRTISQLRQELEERQAKIEALEKMLQLTVDDADADAAALTKSSTEVVEDASATTTTLTKKWKHKVYQLLTQLSLKDVEMRKLEATLEMAVGSRIGEEGMAKEEEEEEAKEEVRKVDSSLIPFVEKIATSCDALFTGKGKLCPAVSFCTTSA